MATYKAEFLSHYYEGRLRPRYAYAMGLVDKWAHLTSFAPEIANFFSQTPGISSVAKLLGGIAPQREMPKFARQTFQSWFHYREPRNQGNPQVLLWADTFNNYFHPHVAAAATEVLESAGYQVLVSGKHLCCGRPLYDYGFLGLAKSYLHTITAGIQPYLESGTPMTTFVPEPPESAKI